jgi:hypothetical protein
MGSVGFWVSFKLVVELDMALLRLFSLSMVAKDFAFEHP